jgi:hypothetical protein
MTNLSEVFLKLRFIVIVEAQRYLIFVVLGFIASAW